MTTLWNQEEVKFLKDNYINMTDQELAEKLNYTVTQVAEKRSYEGLVRRKSNRFIDWKSLEEDYLNEKDLDLLAKKYNISRTGTIRTHLVEKGLYFHNVNRWTEKEIKYLLDNIDKLSIAIIAQNLTRPIASIKNKLQRLNISISNIPVYFCKDCVFYNEKEKVLYNIIKERLDQKLLIDITTINNIVSFDLYKYCIDTYGMGYESFLKTFFDIDLVKYIDENCIIIYKYYRDNQISDMPKGFWNLNNLVKICKDLFKEFSQEYIYENYSGKFLKQYGILNSYLSDNDVLIYDLAKTIFPEYDIYPFLFKSTPCTNGYWDDDNNRFLAIDYMVENLLKNNLISSVEEVTKLTTEVFRDYNLGGLLERRFMYDILSEYLLRKTGKQYKECEFHMVTNGHWKDIENVKKAIRWALEEKEQWNGVDIEWVKNNYSSDLLKKHGLGGMLVNLNSSMSICDLFMISYPNIDIFYWEFNSTPHNFWNVKESSDIALKQLIESRLKLSINDIPKYISKNYFQFNYSKFMVPLIKLYNGNIFEWINSIYPNIFTCRDFGYIECLDGTIVKSLTEQMIHNYLISNYKNVKYITNQKENEGIYTNTKYIPDWILNGSIIVEYLGLYKENKTQINKYDDYHLKTKSKLKIAEKSKLTFIFLYESDLKNNLQGIKQKINELI